ncbi:MAG: phosphate signaling complex protein PhoU [Xanthomonadales bacterium]|nr:phosphate signaling complex protein PhoU [Xanthomonadales bacterium]
MNEDRSMDALNLGQHISQQYNEELDEVRAKVLQMGGVVEEQLAKAIKALMNCDADLGRSVVKNDARVNSLEIEIDEECTRIMARRQPAASDLRLVIAVIKTINDLERIGDEVKRVGKMVSEELQGTIAEDIRNEIEHMGELVQRMLRNVLDAFARTDVDTAIKVVRADRKVDVKYKSITRQLMTHMSQDAKAIPTVMKILWAARAMERMGDRCQNIAEYVIYLVIGEDVRHTSVDDLMARVAGDQK